MFPTFSGRIVNGVLEISELDRRTKILEGKHIAVVVLDLNEKAQVTGGSVIAGVYEGETVRTLGSKDDAKKRLTAAEGKPVMIIVRHELLGPVTAEAFAQRFQFGSKPVELDT